MTDERAPVTEPVATDERPLVAEPVPTPTGWRTRWPAPREPWLVLPVIVAIVLVYAWSGHFWVDLVDEGYFLDLGQRVSSGSLPYRDFTTYYTPGIFYLFAAAFKVFGTNLLVIRYMMAVLRGVCALLLYVLTRRVAPWPLAWLPFTLVFLLDQWPIYSEPHPSWPSLVACLLTMECVVRHLETRRLRWLALAGAAAGLAYVFKQNIGAFAALGVAGYVLMRPRVQTGVWLRLSQVAFVLATALLITILMHEQLDPLAFGALWLPAMVILGLLLFHAMRGSAEAEGSVVRDALVSGGSFGILTAAWLIPLLIALGPDQTPLGLFVGEVNQASIATAFSELTPGIPPLVLGTIWLTTLFFVRRRHFWRTVALALLLTGITLALPIWHGPRDVLTKDPLFQPVLGWLDVNFGTLAMYLPSMAVWAGIGAVALGGRIVAPLLYLLLFGGLASLTMYPRADLLHAIVSSPAALVAATGALAQVCRRFSGWRRACLMTTLLVVPVAAVAPEVAWRVPAMISPDPTAARLDYASLELPSAPVLVPRRTAEDMRNVVAFVDAGTPPGQPLFVFPVAPLFNFLADRPNPTHFDHFLPGTLTDSDFQEVIADLQSGRPRYVVWDDFGVHVWITDPADRPLSDYIWQCYHQVAAFNQYLVMERSAEIC